MSYIEIGLTNTEIKLPIVRIVANGSGGPSQIFRLGWDSPGEIFSNCECAVKGFECNAIGVSDKKSGEFVLRVHNPNRTLVVMMITAPGETLEFAELITEQPEKELK